MSTASISTDRTGDDAPLRSRFQALEDERARTWTAGALAINHNQRALLVREHGTTPHIRPGDILPDISLPAVGGSGVSLSQISAKSPAVLIFFRFSGCPACNIALPYYRDTLWPALSAARIPLIAISPQPPELLSDIVTRQALPFPVVSDTGLALSRALGITYRFDEPSRQAALSKGGNSASLNGLDDTWELPKPAVLIIGPGRVVRFADISPDWMDRTASTTILDALGLKQETTSHAA